MRSVDVLLGGLSALSRSPMRTGLTMLGIAIGVSAMVSMAAISAGAQARIGAEIAAFGANILMVNPGAIKKGGVQQAIGTKQTLTDEDADAIARLPNILAAAPSVSGGAQVVNGNSNWATTVNGTTLSHFAVRLWDVSSGRLFTREEEEGAAKVAVIGKIVAEKLFQDESPIGKIFRINDTPFKVVGVLKEKGSAGGGQSQDDVVFVPILTAKIRLIGTSNMISRSQVGYIIAKTSSADLLHSAMLETEDVLRLRHKMDGQRENDFLVSNAAAMLAAQQSSTETVSRLLATLAAICLVTGGINIMNVMFMTVSERTREIGLRLALGATERDIRNQFIMEATVLCTVSGLLGALAGSVAALLVGGAAGWPVQLDIVASINAVAMASAVGIVFGFFPARRAARLHPIDALRSA